MSNVFCKKQDNNVNELEIIIPDDFHHHLRDDDHLIDTVYLAMQRFNRVVVLPNTIPPIKNKIDAHNYFIRIMEAHIHNKTFKSRKEIHNDFFPLMTLYLTDKTTPQDIIDAKLYGVVACKLYPQGATTNSNMGIIDVKTIYPILEEMSKCGILLLVHCEEIDSKYDIFDREKYGIENILKPIVNEFPQLKIVMEHITTSEGVEFVKNSGSNVAATITAHHLLYNRNDLLVNGIKPHMYCLPVLKTESDREALLKAATSGNPKFFIGTDSAPHIIGKKENDCGCAGIFTAHAAIELYAEAFDSVGKINMLEGFTSVYGQIFYGLPLNKQKIKLIKKTNGQIIPEKYRLGNDYMKPLRGGENITWIIEGCNYDNLL